MSTHTAKPATAQDSPYYLWEVPGSVSIHLHHDVIDRILPEVMRGFGALPRRGAEVGGLLIGRVLQESPLVVSLEDFEPIACEYLTGPSYRLSPRDLARMEESLAQWRDRPIGVVGWFRSHTRKDLFLDEYDWTLIQRYFSDPRMVVLTVKPFATRASLGGFFYWENGQMRLESPQPQFPFNRRELGGTDPVRAAAPKRALAPPPEPPKAEPLPPRRPLPVRLEPSKSRSEDDSTLVLRSPETQPSIQIQPPRFESAASRYEVAPPEEPPPPPPAPEPKGFIETAYEDSLDLAEISESEPSIFTSSGFRWLAAAVTMLFIVGAALIYQALQDTPSPQASMSALPLRLSIHQTGRQLDVSWDREAPSILAAQRGVLAIQDGEARQELSLTAAQLRNGLVRYTRVTGKVNLKLEVFANESASVSESTRVLAPDEASTPEPPPVEPASKPQDTAPTSPVNPYPAVAKADKPPVSVERKTTTPVQETPARPSERRVTKPAKTVRSTPRVRKPAEESQSTPPPAATTPPPFEPAAAEEAPREIARPARRR